jgi:protein-disulfide isomerase
MRHFFMAALAGGLALGLAACQPANEQIETLAKQQEEILAKLKTIEANQKRILAARPTARPQPPAEDYSKVYKIDVTGSPIWGNAKAPVTIVEYSDFQCPYCARATPPLKEVQKKYGDKVRVVFKHFPLSFHRAAKPAAIASMAAAEQGKFWEYHDVLFKNQRGLDASKMEEYAKEAGCDVERFKKDMEQNRDKYTKHVEADFKQGQTVGVRGTPTLFIGGKKVRDRSVNGMSSMVDELLKKES